MKPYIKLNIDDLHLSIGNLCRIIKDLATNKTSALQSEIFCTLFNLESVNDTTINNYCIGCRSINNEYKQKYLILEKKYNKNKTVFIDIVIKIVTILEGTIIRDKDKLNYINKSFLFIKLCNKLYNISKNDQTVTENMVSNIRKLIKEDNYYEAFIIMLLFIVLEKKQPIYESNIKKEIIENILEESNISSYELEEYLSLKFRNSINYNYEMKKLIEKKNAYASYEMGKEEYFGHISGYPRYDKAYTYLYNAAIKGHPGANYLIGNMFLRKKIGSGKKLELQKAYDYFNNAIKYGSIEALNTIGWMYLNGIYPLKKDINKAIDCFKEASKKDFAYAYNNLGKIKEDEKNYKEAFEYYLKSANLGESWACNKVGEYYRKGLVKKDLKEAYKYYNLALDTDYIHLCNYAKYNLAKYFYLEGCLDIVLVRDELKAYELFKSAKEANIFEAKIELLILDIKKYFKNNDKDLYNIIIKEIKDIENDPKYNEKIKKQIENLIKKEKKAIDINLI